MTEPLTTKTRIVGKMLIDWCSQIEQDNSNVHFDRKLCDGLQNIRFTSDNINSVFPQNQYDDGYILCYELLNTTKHTILSVKIDKAHIGKRLTKKYERLLKSMGAADTAENSITLRTWNISDEIENISQIPGVLSQLFDYELSYFETELHAWLNDNSRMIKQFPQFEQEIIHNTDLPQEILIEGAMRDILTNK